MGAADCSYCFKAWFARPAFNRYQAGGTIPLYPYFFALEPVTSYRWFTLGRRQRKGCQPK
ncbi:hypothetical protein EMIT0P12_11103 [Pseudomonas sp. IT-P12]